VKFIQTHIRKYWIFLAFFAVLIGVGFLHFADPPYFQENFWGNLEWTLIGCAIGFVVAFFLAWLYDFAVPGKIWMFYIAIT